MRIAKSHQLKRLLQVQDVALSGLVYALSVDLFWFLGELDRSQTGAYFKLLGIVLAFSALASMAVNARLHKQNFFDFLQFSVHFSFIVFVGFALTEYVGPLRWVQVDLVVVYLGLLVVVLMANRLFLRRWYLHSRREHPSNFLKVVIIGTGARSRQLVEAYRRHVDWQVDIVARVDPDMDAATQASQRGSSVVPMSEFADLLAQDVVDEVVVCVPRSMLNDLQPIVSGCQAQGVSLKFMADLYDFEGSPVTLDMLGNVPIMNVDMVTISTEALIAKRFVDLVGCFLLLALIWPLFIALAILIKLESPGPVFFVQKRVGLNKRTFNMFKFRSMSENAESQIARVEHLNESDGPAFKIQNDPRITPFGRFMRKWSMDELPQLFNVVLGHMSLIGPRPMSLRDVNKFRAGIEQRRFSVRPGLACLREVYGRSNLSFRRWLELDLQYIDTWSFWLDFKIMLRLIPAVLSGKGAH